MKILLIDDSKTARIITKRALKKLGLGNVEILEVDNGPDGVEMTKNQQPDLILCDFNMPGCDGIEVLKELRKGEITTPLGFITSDGRPEIQQEAMKQGATFFVQKPVDAEKLTQALVPVLTELATRNAAG